MRKFPPQALLFVLFSVTASVLPASSQIKENPHTRLRLVAETESVQPGSAFVVGILMNMDPGWHTYWKNPGEAGLATQVRWTLPEGVTALEMLWPAPHKYSESGEVLTYGYENENMLIIPMKVSSLLSSQKTIKLKAEVEWLECEKVCIPGSGVVELELPVRSGLPAEVNVALFERFLGMVPQPLPRNEPFKVSLNGSENGIEIRIDDSGNSIQFKQGESPDFFPELHAGLDAGRTTVDLSGRTTTIRVPFRVNDAGVVQEKFRGLLVFETNERIRVARTVEVPISPPGDVVGWSGSVLGQTFGQGAGSGWDQPFYIYLLFALVGGMILNIMPCVLPVIGLKVFGLVKMGGKDPRQVRKMGWFFSLGILVSFLVLAALVIILKLAGEQVGWGFQFQEPVFVMVMSAVVMAFGLSLFGVFEFQLPATATMTVGDLVTKAGAQGSSNVGSFTEGIFATILATPCTAPILGTALGFAFSQPPLTILLVFSFVAVGMAFPYLLLTMRPSWMKALPKPGEWMVTAKQFMGFLMMATLLWLLYVLGKQVGMEAVIWTSAFLLMVGVACWIVGRFATLSATRRAFVFAWVAAVAIVVVGWFWFAQPILEAKDILQTQGNGNPSGANEIQWEEFSVAVLDRNLNEGKGVFIDFTADWCLTCKVNEKTVLSDEEVIKAFAGSGVVPMKADWTKRNPDITKLLAKFGRSGVPLYVMFPAGRPAEPIVLPEVITSAMVIDAIESGTRVPNQSSAP